MRKFFVAILMFSIAFFALSFIPPVSDGKIGDIRYSILNPQKFIQTHGSGWVLMDGRNINNSNLFQFIGMVNLPDARGVFIRGMNIGRDVTNGDAEGDRSVGQYQADGVKRHQHGFSDAWFAEVNCGHGNILGSRSSDGDNMKCEDHDITDNGVGLIDETRPRNISLYVYVKISN
jgi:hypothetical protein